MMHVDFFLDLLDERFPHEEAERQLTTAVDWGRYVAGVGNESALGIL
jgi:C-terminal AAA-associated domain